MMAKKIVVLGGAGFVGQHLVHELKKEKAQIVVLGRRQRKSFATDVKGKNVKFHYGLNILNPETYEKHLKGADVVYNLVGNISFFQKDKKRLRAINYVAPLHIRDACEKYDVKKLIHVSSTAAFGAQKGIISEDTIPDWSDRKCVYAFSKFAPENQLLRSSMNVVIVNPPMILGPGDVKVLQIFKPVKEGKLPFVSKGRNSDVDVRDLAQALVLVMKKKVGNERFIVISGNHTSQEMINAVARKCGVAPPKLVLPKFLGGPLSNLVYVLELVMTPPVSYENIFFSFKDRRHNDSKIRKLGYVPKYSLDESISDSVDYLERVGAL